MKRLHTGPGLRLQVASDYRSMSRLSAQFIEKNLKQRPDLILCASAGGTPTGVYAELAARSRRHGKRYARMRVLQIDEWGGLKRGNPATCRSDLQTKLLTPMGINGNRFAGFRSDSKNPQRDCQRIARWLAAHGPIDICVLGLGLNGHIAMNEPADVVTPEVHVAKLAPKSLQHNMLKNLARKPAYGLTLGMGDILRSRKILLVVNGPKKRAALKRFFDGPVSSQFPASLLWLHGDVTLICDREAIA
jgi:galactosamine-6-phosphate isomerase